MPKKQKRVSFNIPEKQSAPEDVGISISVSEDPFDSDVETIDDAAVASGGSDSDGSNEASARRNVSEHAKNARKSKRKRVRGAAEGTRKGERKSRLEDEGQTLSSKRKASAKDSESEDQEESASESGTGSDQEDEAAANGIENGVSDTDSDKNSDSDDVTSDDGSSEEDSESDSSDEDSEKDDVDAESTNAVEQREKAPAPITTFSEMGLDARVERAIERMGWRKPTPVQSAVIPAAVAGRDVLVSSPTGSGKTAAYAVPVVQHLCRGNPSSTPGIRCVILVPTRELVHQVTATMKRMCKYVEGVRVGSAAGRQGKKEKREGSFSRASDVLVATPSALLVSTNTDEKNALAGVEFVVVDEADLVLSYGYEEDARAVLSKIPKTSQSLLLSATLEADGMDAFRKVVLRRPLTIKVTAEDNNLDDEQMGATHYYARLKSHKDRYLVTYAMLRLNVICGKVLIFVNQINTAFRLKLFLDQFRLKSAVLNSELPANSRMHCVEQFNAGVFEILIATDESKQDISGSERVETKAKKAGKKRKRAEKDDEFGLTRGVDFKDVAAVFNFDIPEDFSKYTHRAGRTARAGKAGTVLTLVCLDKEEHTLLGMGKAIGVHIGPLAFRMDQIESLRYRVESSLRLVTDTAVHGARLADVRREIVNSEALKDYFEDNPQDLDALQHNMSLAKRIPEHLGHIPSYLLPPALRGSLKNESRLKRPKNKRPKHSGLRGKASRSGADPLKNFSTNGVAGSSRDRYRTKHGIKIKKKDLGRAIKKRRRTY